MASQPTPFFPHRYTPPEKNKSFNKALLRGKQWLLTA